MITDQEMRALADEATEGPWDYDDCEGELQVNAGDARTTWEGGLGTPAFQYRPTNRILEFDLYTWDRGEDANDDQRRDDAAFIAACREWVPDALQRLEAVREFAHLQARPFPDGVPDREGQAIAADLLKILDGRSK